MAMINGKVKPNHSAEIIFMYYKIERKRSNVENLTPRKEILYLPLMPHLNVDKHLFHKEHLLTIKAVAILLSWVNLMNCYSNNNVKSHPQNYLNNDVKWIINFAFKLSILLHL